MLMPVYPSDQFYPNPYLAQPYLVETATRSCQSMGDQKHGNKEENDKKKKERKEFQDMLQNLPPFIKRIERQPKVPGKLQCIDCKIWVNSVKQLKEHYGTARHKSTVAALQAGLAPVRPTKIMKKVKPFSKPVYECGVCEMVINSDLQLLQHLKNTRHQKMMRQKGANLVSF